MRPAPFLYRNRPTVWDNDSLLCDKWLKFGDCRRENCQWDHRTPRPGEALPRCPNVIKTGSTEKCRPECPLSHDLPTNFAPFSRDHGRISPSNIPEAKSAYWSRIRPPRAENKEEFKPVRASKPARNTALYLRDSGHIFPIETTTRSSFDNTGGDLTPVVRIPSTPVSDLASNTQTCSTTSGTSPGNSSPISPLTPTDSWKDIIPLPPQTTSVDELSDSFAMEISRPVYQSRNGKVGQNKLKITLAGKSCVYIPANEPSLHRSQGPNSSNLSRRSKPTSSISSSKAFSELSSVRGGQNGNREQVIIDWGTENGDNDADKPWEACLNNVPRTPTSEIHSSPARLMHPSPRRNSGVNKFLHTFHDSTPPANAPTGPRRGSKAKAETQPRPTVSAVEALARDVSALKTPSPIMQRRLSEKRQKEEGLYPDAEDFCVVTPHHSPFQNQLIAVNEQIQATEKVKIVEVVKVVKVCEKCENCSDDKDMHTEKAATAEKQSSLKEVVSSKVDPLHEDTLFSEDKKSKEEPDISKDTPVPEEPKQTEKERNTVVNAGRKAQSNLMDAIQNIAASISANMKSKPVLPLEVPPALFEQAVAQSQAQVSKPKSKPPSPKPVNTSGYTETFRVCYNCWQLDPSHSGHLVEDCPEPRRDLLEREMIRQQKRIWNKRWAIRLCQDGLADSLYVPPEYLESLKGHIPDSIFKSLEKSDAAERVEIIKKARANTIDEPTSAPVSDLIDLGTSPPPEKTASDEKKSSGSTGLFGLPLTAEASSFGNSQSKPADDKVTVVSGRLCWNCWDSTIHDAQRCPKPQMSYLNREHARQSKNIWCPLWAKLLLSRNLFKILKVPKEQWPFVRNHLEELGRATCFLLLNEKGFIEEVDYNTQVASIDPPSADAAETEEELVNYAVEQSRADMPQECWECQFAHPGYSCEDAKGFRVTTIPRKKTPAGDLLSFDTPEQEKPSVSLEELEAAFMKLDSKDTADARVSSDGLYQYTKDRWANKTPKVTNEEGILVDTLEPELLQPEFTVRSNFEELASLDWPESDSPSSGNSVAHSDELWTPDFSSVSGDGDKSPRKAFFDEDYLEEFVMGPMPKDLGRERRLDKIWRLRRGPRLRSPTRKMPLRKINGKRELMDLPTELLTFIVKSFINTTVEENGLNASTLSVEEESVNQSLVGRRLYPLLRTCTKIRDIGQRLFYRNVSISNLESFRMFLRTVQDPLCGLGAHVEDIRIDIPQVRREERIKGFADRAPQPASEREKRKMRERLHPNTHTWLRRLFRFCPNVKRADFTFIGCIEAFDCMPEKFTHSMLEMLWLKDIDDGGIPSMNLWRNMQQFPNLNDFSITHSDYQMEKGNSGQAVGSVLPAVKEGAFKKLEYLYMHRSMELTDDWLDLFSACLPRLIKITISECNNISTEGFARLIDTTTRPLEEINWVAWLDGNMRPRKGETDTKKKHHLCSAVRKHAKSLITLRMKPISICTCLFEDSEWPELYDLNIDLVEFRACDGKQKENAIKDSMVDAVAPNLMNPVSAYCRLRNPHISFNPARSDYN